MATLSVSTMDARQLYIPISYIANGFMVLDKIGFDAAVANQALRSVGLSPEVLGDPDHLLPGDKFKSLIESLLSTPWPHDPLSLAFIKNTPVATHGMSGLAALSAPTVGDALNTMIEFNGVTMPAVYAQALEDDVNFILRISLTADFGGASEFLLQTALATVFLFDDCLYEGHKMKVEAVHFDHGSSEFFAAYADYFGCPVFPNQKYNQIKIRRASLSLPLKTANVTTHESIVRMLEEKKHALNCPKSISEEATALLRKKAAMGQFLSLDQLADEMNKSKRTLTRHLNKDSVTYQSLLNKIRKEVASRSLVKTNKHLDQIAAEVGFDNRASFFRAFKSWTGMTPRKYRAAKGQRH